MDKPSMCRICLVENVRMYVVASRQLQETFKKLTDVPFITEDRPMLACFFCYAKLKQCSQFHRKCMEAEIAFTQILKGDYELKPVIFQYFRFGKTPVNHVDIAEHQTEVTNQVNLEPDIMKQETPDNNFIEQEVFNNQVILEVCYQDQDDIKQEFLEGNPQEPEVIIEVEEISSNIYCKQEEVSLNHSGVDSDDDVPLTELKAEVQEVTPKKKTKVIKRKGMSVARRTRIKKIADMNSDKHENAKLSDSETEDICSASNHDLKIKDGVLSIDKLNPELIDSIYDTNTTDNSENTVQNTNKSNEDSNCGKKRHLKLFKCDICRRSFSNKSNFLGHIQIHTGDKPYKCDTRQLSSSQKNNFAAQFRVQTEKAYKCDTCELSFREESDLFGHIRFHTGENPYKCDTCQLSFSRKKTMIDHITMHSGDKPYKCDICQRSFSKRRTLIGHVRVHSGLKPYTCDTCQRNFGRKHDLFRHIRLHAG